MNIAARPRAKKTSTGLKIRSRRALTMAVVALLGVAALVGVRPALVQSPPVATVATVRHAPVLNGRVEGSVHLLTGEAVNLNSGGIVKGDLLVPGTPRVRLNGTPVFQGTLDGSGSAQPSNYQVTLNSGSEVRHVRRRTDPVALAPVAAPPAATGTRDVVLNTASQSPGNFSTLRDLTINSSRAGRAHAGDRHHLQRAGRGSQQPALAHAQNRLRRADA